MNLAVALSRLLIFPGLFFAVPFAWFLLWTERKAVARMQERIGPPFMQPAFDFMKLMGKDVPHRSGPGGFLMKALPVIAMASAAGAVGLLPVLPGGGGFAGDLILLISLLEVPSMCLIAAGFSSHSIFGEIGSSREAILSISYNLVFLLSIVVIALTQHSFRMEALTQSPRGAVYWAGVVALIVCLPAKLHLNPFSLPNAEQEIYAGPTTEYAGHELAMWQLAHGLEWVAATGLIAALVLPHLALAWLSALLFFVIAFCVVLLLSVIASWTARLGMDASVRFYWRFALALAVVVTATELWTRMHS